MRNFLKTSFAIAVIALFTTISCLPAFAADDKALINGAKAKVGSKVTYTLNLADCTEDVEGLQVYIMYDQNCLKVDEESLTFPKLQGVVSNTGIENTITFNWTDVKNKADFSKKSALVKMDFEVVKGGSADITYFVAEMYGRDLTYLKSFTFTNDIAVDGKTVIKDDAAMLNTDSEYINRYQGSFTNYDDAKGEKNGKNHKAVIGETQPATNAPTEVTKGQANGGNDITTIITILVIAAIVIAIIIIAVLRRHFNKKDTPKE